MSRIFCENDCAICLESVDPKAGRALFMAECSHIFHFKCIASNVEHGNRTCPLCRANWKHLPFDASHSHPLPVPAAGASAFDDDDDFYYDDDDDDDGDDYEDDEDDDSWPELVLPIAFLDFEYPQPSAPPPTVSDNVRSLSYFKCLLQPLPVHLPFSPPTVVMESRSFDYGAVYLEDMFGVREEELRYDKYGIPTADDCRSGAIELGGLHVHHERDLAVSANVPPDANDEATYLLKMRCRYKDAICRGSIELDMKEVKVPQPGKMSPVERAASIEEEQQNSHFVDATAKVAAVREAEDDGRLAEARAMVGGRAEPTSLLC